jgi:predicted DCC family thiol-disulfide oxidoreductase YuxK
MKITDHILLFDGVCNLCNSTVNFIIRIDRRAEIRFASIQSEAGQSLLSNYEISENLDSVVYIADNRYYIKSSAILHVLRDIGGGWRVFYSLMIFPKSLRDYIYDLIARNRYRIFGKRDVCMVPSSEIKKRFIL